MKTEYNLIEKSDKQVFSENVNEKLKDGWLLHGETRIVAAGSTFYYFQAFIRNIK